MMIIEDDASAKDKFNVHINHDDYDDDDAVTKDAMHPKGRAVGLIASLACSRQEKPTASFGCFFTPGQFISKDLAGGQFISRNCTTTSAYCKLLMEVSCLRPDVHFLIINICNIIWIQDVVTTGWNVLERVPNFVAVCTLQCTGEM